MLAVSLLTPQPLLLADEPFDGLDLRQTREVGAALRDHAAEGRTLFLSIHQISDAARVCDRFVLLSSGRVCAEGTIDELRTRTNATLARTLRTSKISSLPSRKIPVRVAAREGMARAAGVARVVGHAPADRTAGRGVVHQRRAHLRGAERLRRHGRGRWRSVFAAGRRLGADLQRLRAGGRVPPPVRRHSRRRRGSTERRAEAGTTAADARVLARRRQDDGAHRRVDPGVAAGSRGGGLWRGYGGHIYAPELGAVIAGHLLNAGLTIALASAAASLADHPSTAAIVTLSVTVGTWIVNFIAAVHGGIWERAAGYTPTAMVAEFQHGLIRADVVVAASALVALGLGVAAIWMRLGVPVSRKVYESIGAGAMASATIFAATFVTASRDLSENRMNSFPRADEEALERIHEPLRIEAHLAAEDPRRVDLERKALSKLRRVMPKMQVRYVANTSTGLFEQTDRALWRNLVRARRRRAMSRSTTAEGVLETIYSAGRDGAARRGRRQHFPRAPARGAAAARRGVFYGIWPALVIAAGVSPWRRQ